MGSVAGVTVVVMLRVVSVVLVVVGSTVGIEEIDVRAGVDMDAVAEECERCVRVAVLFLK